MDSDLSPVEQITRLTELHRRLMRLKLLPRVGWLERGVQPCESIAEHLFGVTVLALLVGPFFPQINRERLLSMSIVHDLAESLIGDWSHAAQSCFPPDVKHAGERTAMHKLFDDLFSGEEILELWEDYNARRTPEARLVKALDRLETLSQSISYEQSGHRQVIDMINDTAANWSDEFPLLRDLADAWYRQHLADNLKA